MELEVIVQDNFSSDDTWRIAESFNDPRLRIFSTELKLTAAENWSSACLKATGDFVKLLPVDDTLLAGSLMEQSSELMNDEGLAFVASWRQLTTARGSSLPKFIGALVAAGVYSRSDIKSLARKSPRNFFGEPGCVLFRSHTLKNCLPWRESGGYAFDLELYFRALSFGDVKVIDKVHSTFQLTGGSISSKAKSAQVKDTLMVIEDFLNDKATDDFLFSKSIERRIIVRSALRRFAFRVFS